MKKIFLISFLFFLIINSNAQIGVGEWREHLSFSYIYSLTQSPTKIYSASANALFEYNKSAHNISKLTKVDGLSDVGVSSILYSNENETLLVGYSNGNIDLITNNSIINISDIKREAIIGDKSINDILFIDNYAYLSCGFGIVVLDVDKKEIKETYYIGDNGTQIFVNKLIRFGDYFYASTKNGLYKTEFANSNLADYHNWIKINDILNSNDEFGSMAVFNNNLFVNHYSDNNNIIYQLNNNEWTEFRNDSYRVRNIKSEAENLFIVDEEKITKYNSNLESIEVLDSYNSSNANPYDIIIYNNNWWIADKGNGTVKYNGGFEFIHPNGPYTSNSYSVKVSNDIVFVTAGSMNSAWNNVWINGMIYYFENEQWKSLFNYNVKDLVNICIDESNPSHFYATSWEGGILEYNNFNLESTFDETNSELQSIYPGENFVRCKGITLDKDKNLWITNSGVSKPIVVKKSDNSWKSFTYDGLISNINLGKILITQDNNKWLVIPRGGGLFAFNNNGTIDNEDDDIFKKFDVIDSEEKIITNDIYSIAEDLDGDIWLGTDQGVVVYFSPEDIFTEESAYAQQIILTIGDHTERLLHTEIVTAIAVDGANQKWFGTTSSGVFLMSEDGTKELYHFTSENSPLLSNTITDIGINHESGEVFFSTDKGLISYRASATQGSDDFRNVYVYPNPVRPNYDGDITIRGLVSDVNVKITDISGNIVYETTANGGQATWNGENFSGQKVSTGIYLVFCSNEDGSKTFITKLLFIK
ncbi:MAG: T9SS type A sorting domain-containing protein [Bacteroidota bacterium]|nr:T9SS type A sorting domain-containing protein [Bacteroidota bacterium]